jgi:hypothetical protein
VIMHFLERVVSEEGISTVPDQVKTVQDWPRPKTPKQMRGISWSLLLLQEMCENFAFIARPLHKLCDKGSIFQWNDECEQVCKGSIILQVKHSKYFLLFCLSPTI